MLAPAIIPCNEDAPMPTPQSYKNHTRYHPPFHFVIIPLLILNLIFSIYITVHNWPGYQHTHLWNIVMAIVFLLMAGNARESAMKAQDRVIRLEERLRLMQLLSEPLRSRIPEITEDQLVGLRFASDAEVPKLAERALNEKLSRKQIKQAIQNWRPDYWRV